jgi:hypothetical protein
LPVHGVTSWGWLSRRGRVLSRAGIGVLSWVASPDLVDEAVGDGLAWEMRLRAVPSRLGVYFVLGLCLFSDLPYGQVLRELISGLEAALAAAGWRVPAATALTRARRRIGEKPLESLFRRLCSALSPGCSPWSHAGGLLVVAWDVTIVDAGDSAPCAAAFGKPGTGGKRRPAKEEPRTRDGGRAGGRTTPGQQAGQQDGGGAYPQLRLVTLIACGTRALLDAAFGPLRGQGAGEQALARGLLGSLHEGMLLLADRNFYGYQLWNAAAATSAHLLWRVKGSMHLPVVRELPDGSYLAHINDPRDRLPGMQDLPARPRTAAAQPDPGPGPPGTLGLPGHLPGHPRHHRPRRRRRRARSRPDLLHRHPARRPPHREHRPRQHAHRAHPDRNRDLVLPRPPARRTHLPPGGEQAALPVPVQAQSYRPAITTCRLHHHHHHTRRSHPNQH